MEVHSNLLQFCVYVLCERTTNDAATWNYKTEEGLKYPQFCVYVVCEMTNDNTITWKYKTEECSNFLRLCVYVQ